METHQAVGMQSDGPFARQQQNTRAAKTTGRGLLARLPADDVRHLGDHVLVQLYREMWYLSLDALETLVVVPARQRAAQSEQMHGFTLLRCTRQEAPRDCV